MSKTQSKARRQISSRAWRLGAASVVASGVACAAIVPASAMAAPAVKKPQTVSYNVPVKPLALASGKTVKATAVVTSPQANVSNWWNQKTVNAVVRKGVNGGYQSPYQAQGYQCVPKVKPQSNGSSITSFNCKLQGADVPTTVRLSYNVVYRGDTASG